MKIRFLSILIFICLAPGTLISQKTITLKECYDGALGIPWQGKKISIIQYGCSEDENLAKNWMPALDANGDLHLAAHL